MKTNRKRIKAIQGKKLFSFLVKQSLCYGGLWFWWWDEQGKKSFEKFLVEHNR